MGWGEDVFDELKKTLENLTVYLNPIGKFYFMYYQLMFRVLFVEVILDDIFELADNNGADELVCDTNQVACAEMCHNRFAPISFLKLWQMELYTLTVLGAITAVTAKGLGIIPKKYLSESAKDTIVKNVYICALVLRLFLEYKFLRLEMDLAEHQSGKNGLISRFILPEKYICVTNYYKNDDSTSIAWQDTSRFYVSEKLEACDKQPFAIPCWIVDSRIKTKGILWMFFVQVGSTILTFFEIFWEFFRMCCCGKKN